jgi:hypothetical protein
MNIITILIAVIVIIPIIMRLIMNNEEREAFLKKLQDLQKNDNESKNPSSAKKEEANPSQAPIRNNQVDAKAAMEKIKKLSDERKQKERDKNNRMDNGDFWNTVKRNTSHNITDDGNKIPEVRSMEELMELIMKDPSNLQTFNKQERELVKKEMDKQQEEFKKLPFSQQKEILDESYKMMTQDPNISDAEKEKVKEVNEQFLKSIKNGEDMDESFSTAEAGGVMEAEPEPEEPVDVDGFLADIFGEEVETMTEYTQDDYEILVDDNRILFHIDYKVPARTHFVFKDLIEKLELTKDDDNYFVFPRSSTELKYWLKEENVEFTENGSN